MFELYSAVGCLGRICVVIFVRIYVIISGCHHIIFGCIYVIFGRIYVIFSVAFTLFFSVSSGDVGLLCVAADQRPTRERGQLSAVKIYL